MWHEDRLFPCEPGIRRIARRLYESTSGLPVVSPHGHCDPEALATDDPFGDPAVELVTRDHYLVRMLYSQGVPMEALGVRPLDGGKAETDGRQIWRTFSEHAHLFRGTPSKLWLDHTLSQVFDMVHDLLHRLRIGQQFARCDIDPQRSHASERAFPR